LAKIGKRYRFRIGSAASSSITVAAIRIAGQSDRTSV
jgi:hypothetical protein